MSEFIPFNSQNYQDDSVLKQVLLWYIVENSENRTITFSTNEIDATQLLALYAKEVLVTKNNLETGYITISIETEPENTPFPTNLGISYQVREFLEVENA